MTTPTAPRPMWRKLHFRLLGYALVLGVLWLLVYLLLANPVFTRTNEELVNPVDPEELKRHVAALVSTPEPRNFQNLNSLNQAADYIRKTWEAQGYEVHEQLFEADGRQYKNLIVRAAPGARVTGDSQAILVIGAHYDVAHNQSGADDNASGVAGLLELTRLAKLYPPRRPVEFAAYTLEEPPYFSTQDMGSSMHARSLKEAGASVKAMISLEMIGFFSEAPGSQSFPIPGLALFYPNRGSFIALVGKLGDWTFVRELKTLMQPKSRVDVKSINAPSWVPGIDFSDHMNFWKLGFPAVMITDTAFMRNPNYHQPTDTIETLDFEKMAEVVHGVSGIIENF